MGGLWFLKKHGHTPYQRIRTLALMAVQWIIAFTIPVVMQLFATRSFYFSLFWPLKIEYFYPRYIFNHPLPIILYAFLTSLVAVPLVTFLWGKRWYCSWVCGCGGLAETAGDPFRHLSNRGTRAWRFELVAIHTVLGLAIVTTALVIVNWSLGQVDGGRVLARYPGFSSFAFGVQRAYGFVVLAMLSGVFGVGLYPLLGSRVWCRFFCPQAAVLGLVQKFGRFRITVKDDMCIACGNCSGYCEMGIDVRAYAMTNRSFKRAACVGCGMCAHVCPRGVLRLENRWDLGPDARDSNLRVPDI
jgi:polyferredoxin